MFVFEILENAWDVFFQLAPFLLLGMFLAGLLHVYIKKEMILKHFGGGSIWGSVKASLLGVPLPVCSCGVLPLALGLKKQGAGNGPVISFLISTPQTGVDSILVMTAFFGWPIAIYRAFITFLSGVIGGWGTELVDAEAKEEAPVKALPEITYKETNWYKKLGDAIHYGFFDLLKDIDKALVIGILLAGVITWILPDANEDSWLVNLGKNNEILLVLAVIGLALPMYVCASGSVPIAFALYNKGMPVWVVLVFLMVGPATNMASLLPLVKAFGKKIIAVYLATIVICSIVFGKLYDYFLVELFPPLARNTETGAHHHHTGTGFVHWLEVAAATVLGGLLIYLLSVKFINFIKPKKEIKGESMKFKMETMNCQGCVGAMQKVLKDVAGIEDISGDPETKILTVSGEGLNKNDLLAKLIEGNQKGEILEDCCSE